MLKETDKFGDTMFLTRYNVWRIFLKISQSESLLTP